MDTLTRQIELVSNLLQRDTLIPEFEDLSIASWVSSWARRKRSPLPPRESREDRYSALGQTAPAVALAGVSHPCAQRDFLPCQGLLMSCRHPSVSFSSDELIERFQVVLEFGV